jgi:hypothetical protein
MLKTKKMGAAGALVCFLNLAGCGQTGPLYLPPKTAHMTPSPVASVSTSTSTPIIAHLGVS